jgi:hypothetical protein
MLQGGSGPDKVERHGGKRGWRELAVVKCCPRELRCGARAVGDLRKVLPSGGRYHGLRYQLIPQSGYELVMPETPDKVREKRVRRMAERQGLILRKSRRRDRRAWDFGSYWLMDADRNALVFPDVHGGSLEDMERYLTSE